MLSLGGWQCRPNIFRAVRRLHNILGIETSCDDTGVAVLDTQGRLLGESLFSQQEIHTEFGGIMPPVARDLHKKNIDSAVSKALTIANLEMSQVDAIAVTVKPGLSLSLLVGLECAKKLSSTYKKPLIPIHHMEAHALTIRMVEKVDFPFLVVLISGGHSLIAVAQDIEKFLLLGKSYDDAPGEALDKIARRLKLFNLNKYQGLSGGRAVELAALNGNMLAFPISEPLLHRKNCNFSFAGIKNSVRSYIIEEENKHDIKGDEILPNVEDICASVQFAVTKHILRRVHRSIVFCKEQKLINSENKVVVSGGVACNSFIGKAIRFISEKNNLSCCIPPPKLCSDNGVMIAWNGVERWKAQKGIINYTDLDKVDIQAKCSLGVDVTEEVEKTHLNFTWVKFKDLVEHMKV
ncbi:probable tRNA N6-adenosine threonylcarbamoyltransferase, mitochondrial [Cimex lectularius]|uniref:N(6)-L-threonylcarbamoyladenine synthase n=1 Tax=Cimex lectularius TaxID=79782 RepID=A0A8I6TJ82_CIMLE|nr:probable tRNA N6-adenosine threonylcarbamoyltransferase, mitochondrial [Cimex lectularius]